MSSSDSPTNQNLLNVSDAELHTIIAALRFYQSAGQGNPDQRSEAIHDIATNGGDQVSLDENGISDLCESLCMSSSVEQMTEYLKSSFAENGEFPISLDSIALELFDIDECEDYIASHGFGSPTQQGMILARQLFIHGNDYATIGHEVVARGMTSPHES